MDRNRNTIACMKGANKLENTQYLENKINSSGKKKTYLARKLGISRQTFSKKCKNPSLFSNLKAEILCEEIGVYKNEEKDKIFLQGL